MLPRTHVVPRSPIRTTRIPLDNSPVTSTLELRGGVAVRLERLVRRLTKQYAIYSRSLSSTTIKWIGLVPMFSVQ